MTTSARLPGPSQVTLPRAETLALTLLFALALLLRVVEIFQFHYNSDESQHLHVAWAWTQGLVQYRDIFDNHTPLYHLLSAPFVYLIGSDPRILIDMRLLQLVPFAFILYLVYRIAIRYFGKSIACWTTLFFAVFPAAFFRTLEYRPLILWLLLWLAAIVILLRGPLTVRRAAAVGFLFGLNLLVSLKTVLMLAALGLAGVLLPVVLPDLRSACRPARLWRPVGVFLLTMSVPPACLVLAYVGIGALQPLIYCTILHNIVPDQGSWSHPEILLLLPLGLTATVFLARWLARRAAAPVGYPGIHLLILITGSFLSLLAVWPLVTNQTVVPIYPLLLILVVGVPFTDQPLAAGLDASKAPSQTKDPLWVPIIITLAQVGIIIGAAPPWRHDTASENHFFADILRITRPSEYVLDQKGESIFRRRPFYFAFETITRERLKLGLIKDDLSQRLIDTRTPVVVNSQYRFPPKDRAFIKRNYVPVGPFYVLGQWVSQSPRDKIVTAAVHIRIPARYALYPASVARGALIDGKPFSSPQMLAKGVHSLTLPPGADHVALVWARAVQQGYKPLEHKP